ncbi:D-arabinono-1,4-lactone oxidase [Kineosporia babensis]|uniref:FAD-binding protein n=1 Tax=Kineosporia babensis TaxID=499548 RepID=A0A9X1NKG9_9ACTN|nr:D-arabinono-1,4-lactone oxidase [Kineosporia babensis]MCD5316687.1 FAD-binding protein [Kineosporia babensis]
MISEAKWANWAGCEQADCSVLTPRGTDEIVEAVRDAAAQERRLRPIGSSHSFSGIARPEDLQLRLDRHAGVISIDTTTGLVTVEAGMPLHRLNDILAGVGLALPNLGDIDRQTVAGALATGTHGTGTRFSTISAQLRALELVTADGEVLRCSPTENPYVFEFARVSLGALGVISTVTLQTVPAFALRVREVSLPLAEVLADFTELAEGIDHFELYWFPHTDRVQTRYKTRLPLEDGLAPLGRMRTWFDEELVANDVFRMMVATGRRVPAVVVPLNRVAVRLWGSRTYTDRSERVFITSRRVRFKEMEYAIPRARLPEAMRRVRDAVENAGWRIPFPVEIRVLAPDDIPLSMASGRETAFIAVHVPARAEHAAYFGAVERIMADYGGRPHWGKLHGLDVHGLRRVYPLLDEFAALRDRLDPKGMFSNGYLDRVLGRVGAASG